LKVHLVRALTQCIDEGLLHLTCKIMLQKSQGTLSNNINNTSTMFMAWFCHHDHSH